MIQMALVLSLFQPCQTEDFHFPEVAWACAEEGVEGAKKLMKEIVTVAKSKESDINCKTCHKDLKKFELKDGAYKKMERWLNKYEEDC